MSRHSLLLTALAFTTSTALAQCTFTQITIGGGSDPHGEGVNKYDTVIGTFNDNVTGRQRGFRWNGGHYTT